MGGITKPFCDCYHTTYGGGIDMVWDDTKWSGVSGLYSAQILWWGPDWALQLSYSGIPPSSQAALFSSLLNGIDGCGGLRFAGPIDVSCCE